MPVAVRAAATVAPLAVAALAAGEGEGSSAPARRQLHTQVAAGRPATHTAAAAARATEPTPLPQLQRTPPLPLPCLHCYARRRAHAAATRASTAVCANEDGKEKGRRGLEMGMRGEAGSGGASVGAKDKDS